MLTSPRLFHGTSGPWWPRVFRDGTMRQTPPAFLFPRTRVPSSGARVTPSGAATVSPSASPEAYTLSHLAERILTARSALGGERKQVTVLCAVGKGSMEVIRYLDPGD